MSVPPPHRRILPHMEISEQGLRELEIWLLGRLGDGGSGLRYHKGTYGAHNKGDWLSVETTSGQSPTPIPAFTAPGMVFKAQASNVGGGIVLWARDDVNNIDSAIVLTTDHMLYYLGGADDIGYTQGGEILRYSLGGQVLFDTSNDDESGDFFIETTGSSDGSSGHVTVVTTSSSGISGNILLETRGISTGASGSITLNARGGLTPGSILMNTSSAPVSTPASGCVLTQIATDATWIINDNDGNPLVTYTG